MCHRAEKAKVFKADPVIVWGECNVRACEKNLSFCRWPPRASLSHTHTAVHTHVDITNVCAFKCTRATCRHIHHGLRDQTHLSTRYAALGQTQMMSVVWNSHKEPKLESDMRSGAVASQYSIVSRRSLFSCSVT